LMTLKNWLKTKIGEGEGENLQHLLCIKSSKEKR
jgi:hypothetical protein